jgi:hypothetical protein
MATSMYWFNFKKYPTAARSVVATIAPPRQARDAAVLHNSSTIASLERRASPPQDHALPLLTQMAADGRHVKGVHK